MTAPLKLEIELDLDQYTTSRHPIYDSEGDIVDYEASTLAEIVIEVAARQLLQQLDQDTKRQLATTVSDIRDEVIRERLAPIITEAIEGPYQKTSYGRPVGEPRSLHQDIMEATEKALQPSFDHYNRGSRTDPVGKFIKEQVDRALVSELRTEMDAARKQVSQAIRDHGARMLAETIEKLAK